MTECLECLGIIVVYMEDDDSHAYDMKMTIEECGLIARRVESKEEACKLAEEEHQIYFIFDMDMGEGRQHEGLDALETIRSLGKKVFVAILTGYPDEYKAKCMAINLEADIFLPKTEIHDDIRKIALCILQNNQTASKEHYEHIYNYLNAQHHDCQAMTEMGLLAFEDTPVKDINAEEYKRFKSDKEWLRNNMGYYIAIVDGELVGKDRDRDKIINKIISDYHGENVYFTLVEEHEVVEDIPSPFII